jgi:hypothetical protein
VTAGGGMAAAIGALYRQILKDREDARAERERIVTEFAKEREAFLVQISTEHRARLDDAKANTSAMLSLQAETIAGLKLVLASPTTPSRRPPTS